MKKDIGNLSFTLLVNKSFSNKKMMYCTQQERQMVAKKTLILIFQVTQLYFSYLILQLKSI